MKDLQNRIPCSVSQELVDVVANTYPESFKDENGNINIPKLLFFIGFKINYGLKTLGYYKNFDVLVRDNEMPSKVYKTACVYNGEVRNTVLDIDSRGRFVYTRTKHSLASLYEQIEIVHPNNLKDIVPEEEWTDILEIGDPEIYDKAFRDKRRPDQQDSIVEVELDEDKKYRNIVRN